MSDEGRRDEIVERLGRLIRPEFLATWLDQPLDLLDGSSPNELLARGEYERVSRLVAGLEEPGAV